PRARVVVVRREEVVEQVLVEAGGEAGARVPMPAAARPSIVPVPVVADRTPDERHEHEWVDLGRGLAGGNDVARGQLHLARGQVEVPRDHDVDEGAAAGVGAGCI
ncbi:hypothetical protein KEM52_004610, partial [Ascosphaera acerosa]